MWLGVSSLIVEFLLILIGIIFLVYSFAFGKYRIEGFCHKLKLAS